MPPDLMVETPQESAALMLAHMQNLMWVMPPALMVEIPQESAALMLAHM